MEVRLLTSARVERVYVVQADEELSPAERDLQARRRLRTHLNDPASIAPGVVKLESEKPVSTEIVKGAKARARKEATTQAST